METIIDTTNTNLPAVVLIDLQEEFLRADLPSKVGSVEKRYCLPGVLKLLTLARKNQWTIFHVGTKHLSSSTLPIHRQKHPPYCLEGSEGVNFSVTINPGEHVLYKTHYGAFTNTKLAKCLEGHRHVIFAGVAVDCCILKSVFEADALGFSCYVPFQCVSATTLEAFLVSLVSLSKSAANIIDLDAFEVTANLQGGIFLEDKASIEQKARPWFVSQQAS